MLAKLMSNCYTIIVVLKRAIFLPTHSGGLRSHGLSKEASRCRIEVAGYVAFYDPLVEGSAVTGESIADVCHCVIGASIWPESIGMDTEIGFPYGFQDHAEGFLYNSVAYTRDPLSTLPLFPSSLWNL